MMPLPQGHAVPARRVLYLHGFRSGPSSAKSRRLADHFAQRGLAAYWLAPQLPVDPAEAFELVLSLAKGITATELVLVGSSLGGFYAHRAASQLGCRAVCLNPAVHPARDLAAYVGPLTRYHDGRPMQFLPQHISALETLESIVVTSPSKHLLVAAQGDELLDWREMSAAFEGSPQLILPGHDHGLVAWHDLETVVMAACGLSDKLAPVGYA
jgi:predicted esterase YcpF (UPF0227 family)